jgi:DNA-binding NarL/FixJ family response regulator
LAHDQKWDVVVLDLTMPGRGGFEVLQEFKRSFPGLPILVLSMHPEDQFAVRAFRAGADGYMAKESAPETLVAAIRKVVSGGKYVPPSIAEMLASDLGQGANRPPHDLLSHREFQVMRLLAAGRTVTEIADELSLSIKTISTYRCRVLEKMNLRTNADLTRYAIEHQLIL